MVIEISAAAATEAAKKKKQADLQAEVAELQSRLKEQLETLRQVEELGFSRREVPRRN